MTQARVRALAYGSFAVAAACSAAAIAITSRNGPVVVEPDFGGLSTSLSLTVAFSILLLCFSLVGVTLALKRPDNGLGWLFCGGGLVLAFSNLASAYETHGISTNPGSLPGAEWFGLASDVLWVPFIASTTVFLFLWFPEGKPVETGRRRASRIAMAGVLLATIASAPYTIVFEMTTSMSYSRYLSTAIATLTGIANRLMPPATCTTTGTLSKIVEGTKNTNTRPAAYTNHRSCSRSSPVARRKRLISEKTE